MNINVIGNFAEPIEINNSYVSINLDEEQTYSNSAEIMKALSLDEDDMPSVYLAIIVPRNSEGVFLYDKSFVCVCGYDDFPQPKTMCDIILSGFAADGKCIARSELTADEIEAVRAYCWDCLNFYHSGRETCHKNTVINTFTPDTCGSPVAIHNNYAELRLDWFSLPEDVRDALTLKYYGYDYAEDRKEVKEMGETMDGIEGETFSCFLIGLENDKLNIDDVYIYVSLFPPQEEYYNKIGGEISVNEIADRVSLTAEQKVQVLSCFKIGRA